MSLEQVGTNAGGESPDLLIKVQEEKVRSEIASTFETNYLKYFFPYESSRLDETSSLVLISLDDLGKNKNLFQVVHKQADRELVIPYLDLKERFMHVFENDLSPSQQKPIKREGKVALPNYEGLSDRLAWYSGKEVFFYSNLFTLLPYNNGFHKGIEQVQLAQDADRNSIGEFWMGHKWDPEKHFIPSAFSNTTLIRSI